MLLIDLDFNTVPLQISMSRILVRKLSTGISMELKTVVSRLQTMAPTSLAGSWDNVGLLVEPSPPHKVNKILLTNDLTPPVLNEAIEKKSDMIISYHPPIFSALKRLTQKKWKEEIIVKCIENRIAVYSPHTTYDCVLGGVNDWLISCFDCKEVKPVEQHTELGSHLTHKISFSFDQENQAEVTAKLKSIECLTVLNNYATSSDGCQCYAECLGNMQSITIILQTLPELKNLAVNELSQIPILGHGMGRKAKLKEPLPLEEAVKCVKNHLQLDFVRLACAPDMSTISSVAVCAGSGSSVLRDVKADLYVTGEMSHHDVLHAVFNGSSVILCDHSNTERGFLKVLRSRLMNSMEEGVQIDISQTDEDPLKVV